MIHRLKALFILILLVIISLSSFGNNMPNSRLDSVTLCLNSSDIPNHILTVILKDGACYAKVDSIERFNATCFTDGIYTINNQLLERTIYFNVSYENIDAEINSVLTALVNKLFIQRTERVLQSYNDEGFGLLHDRFPTISIIVKLHYTDEKGYSEVSFEIEDEGNYTNNSERIMMADYREYTPSCRKLIVLLHYVALKCNLKIPFEQDVVKYIKHNLPSVRL